MMENVKWLIQKRGVSIIVLLVTVIACGIVLRGSGHEKTEDMEGSCKQQAEFPDSWASVIPKKKVCLFTEEEKKQIQEMEMGRQNR